MSNTISYTENISPYTNENKVVYITSNSTSVSGNDGTDSSWKHNIKRILSFENTLTSSDKTFFNKSMNKTEVRSDVYLTMDSNYPEIRLTNTFDYPIKNIIGKAAGFVNDNSFNVSGLSEALVDSVYAIKNDSGTSKIISPWSLNVPAYSKESIKGISFQYTFKFAMGKYGLWNAEEEVVKPILNLFIPVMIRDISNFTISPPFPAAAQMYVNIFTESFDTSKQEYFQNFIKHISNALQESYKDYTFNVSFGNFMNFRHLIISGAVVNFSKETDQFGWPISGSITMDFKGVMPISSSTSLDSQVALRFGGSV